MNAISDNTIIRQLKDEDNASFKLLYQFYFPVVASYITNNYGNTADAEDVFQETIIVLLHKVRQPNFILSSSLKTYLFAIAKNTWLKRLRDNKMMWTNDIETYQKIVEADAKPQCQSDAEHTLVQVLQRITENCQRILKAIFFYKEPMENLMKKMGWKNKHTAANQQYKCLQQAKQKSKAR